MRVTQRMMMGNTQAYMSENLQRLYGLQEKAASGKQFQRASENPSGAAAALNLRSNLEAGEAFLDTAHVIDEWMSTTDFSLRQVTQVGTRAINLTLQGISDTLSANERQALAAELDVILQEAVGVGNTAHQGNYIFAGHRTTTRPFQMVDTNADGLYDVVNYQGDAGVMLRNIGPGQAITQNVDGNAALSPLFSAMISARDALNSNNTANIQAAAAALQAAIRNVSDAATVNGARQRQVRLSQDRLEKAQIELKSLLSQKEDANMAEVISSLRHQETVYQTVLEVGHRAISALSLFDMLS